MTWGGGGGVGRQLPLNLDRYEVSLPLQFGVSGFPSTFSGLYARQALL